MGQTCLSSFHAVGSPSAAPAGAQSRQTPGSSQPHRLLTREKGVLSTTDRHVIVLFDPFEPVSVQLHTCSRAITHMCSHPDSQVAMS